MAKNITGVSPAKQPMLLGSLPEAEIMAAIALYDEPLYQYAVENGQDKQLNVLVIGTGDVAKHMVKMALMCGQMLAYALHLHVVAKDAQAFRDELLAGAPALHAYVAMDGAACDGMQLASMSFESISGLNANVGNSKAFAHLADYRYIVVDLPDKNDRMVEALLKKCAGDPTRRFIAYSGAAVEKDKALKQISLSCNNTWTSRKISAATSLSALAFRLHYYYERQYGNPGLSMQACRQDFESSAYAQRANLASVIHMKYKLQSIGINPTAQGKTIMRECATKLFGDDTTLYDTLSYLEHNRWLMEKVLAGYRAPTMTELENYCYIGGNYKWRSDKLMFHNCVLESQPRSKSSLRGLLHQEWDALCTGNSLAAINATSYDPLDKMSLTVHCLAGRMMKERRLDLNRELEKLEARLNRLAEHDPSSTGSLGEIYAWLDKVYHGEELYRQQEMTALLQTRAAAFMLSDTLTEPAVQLIRDVCALSREFHAYKDYKAMDDSVIDLLPMMYGAPACTTVLKIASEKIIENIASVLLLEPEQAVYFDMAEDVYGNVERFFENRGSFVAVRRAEAGKKRAAALKKEITAAAAQGMCIIDVTGADAADVMAVSDIVRDTKNTAIITCDSKNQRIENLMGYPQAPCVRRYVKLKVEEIFMLMGTVRQTRVDANDALLEKGNMDNLWHYYRENAEDMFHVTHLMMAMSNFTLQNNRVPMAYNTALLSADTPWLPMEQKPCSLDIFRAQQTENLLYDMQNAGLLKDLNIFINEVQRTAAWHCMAVDKIAMFAGNLLTITPNQAYYKRMKLVPQKTWLRLEWADAADNSLYVNAEFSRRPDGLYNISYQNSQGKSSSCFMEKERIAAILQALQGRNLIYGLYMQDLQMGAKLRVTFFFRSEAIRHFIQMSGSFLESKVWAEAVDLQVFDDVCTNYKFRWNADEATENELDVLMVKGMQLFVCSCKAAKVESAYLYEIYCLAKRFSRDAMPMLAHTGRIERAETQRAQMLGVTLANAFCDDNLQQALRSIANA